MKKVLHLNLLNCAVGTQNWFKIKQYLKNQFLFKFMIEFLFNQKPFYAILCIDIIACSLHPSEGAPARFLAGLS